MCLGPKPGPAAWKAQTNPLSYGGTPSVLISYVPNFFVGYYTIPVVVLFTK